MATWLTLFEIGQHKSKVLAILIMFIKDRVSHTCWMLMIQKLVGHYSNKCMNL
jgi:hypothetical protein